MASKEGPQEQQEIESLELKLVDFSLAKKNGPSTKILKPLRNTWICDLCHNNILDVFWLLDI